MLKVLAAIMSILYPVIIFISLYYFGASPRVLAFLLLSVGMVYFIANTNNLKTKGFKKMQLWGTLIIVTVLAAATMVTENAGFIKFYPVFVNLFLLLSFAITLFHPPNMILRFAMMKDKNIHGSDNFEEINSYCRKVTITWVFFFVFNGGVALFTALFANYKIWTFYNGFLSYILIGIMILTEIIIRKYKVKT